MSSPASNRMFFPLSTEQVPTSSGKHVSCCAVVRGLQRNLFVVPRDDVSTPEIAALEERLESDPGARAALLPLLHVRRRACGRDSFSGGG